MNKLKLIAVFLIVCGVCVLALKLGYTKLFKDAPSTDTVAQSMGKVVNFDNTSEMRFERSGKMTRYFDGDREGIYLYTIKTDKERFGVEVRWTTKREALRIESIYRIEGMNSAKNLYRAP